MNFPTRNVLPIPSPNAVRTAGFRLDSELESEMSIGRFAPPRVQLLCFLINCPLVVGCTRPPPPTKLRPFCRSAASAGQLGHPSAASAGHARAHSAASAAARRLRHSSAAAAGQLERPAAPSPPSAGPAHHLHSPRISRAPAQNSTPHFTLPLVAFASSSQAPFDELTHRPQVALDCVNLFAWSGADKWPPLLLLPLPSALAPRSPRD